MSAPSHPDPIQAAFLDELTRIGDRKDAGEITEAEARELSDAVMALMEERMHDQARAYAEAGLREAQEQRQRKALVPAIFFALVVLGWLAWRAFR